MTGLIGPMNPLVCLECGSHHYELQAEVHHCCSEPKLIPWQLTQQIEDPDMQELVAELFHSEYNDFDYVYCCPNHPNLIEIEKPSGNSSSIKLPRPVITFLRTIKESDRVEIAKQLAYYLSLEKKIHSELHLVNQTTLHLI